MLVVMICKSVGNTKRASNNIPWHNPEELRIGIIRMLYGAHYDIVVLYVGTEDQGHDGGTRYRLYALLNHRERVTAVYDAKEMYARITSVIRQHVRTQPCDYLVSTEEEIMLDAGETARVRNKRLRKATYLHLIYYGCDLLQCRMHVI
jgi:hypothetical protein